MRLPFQLTSRATANTNLHVLSLFIKIWRPIVSCWLIRIGAGGAVCGCPPRFRTSRNPQRGHMRQPARSRFDFAGVAAACIASASLNTQAHSSHPVYRRLLAKDENSIAPSPCSHIEAKSQAAHLHAAIGCCRAAGLNASQGRA
jgi:hypothetical protein